MSEIDRAVIALRAIWPTLGHPDHWSEAEEEAALQRIAQTVLDASDRD